MKKNSNLNFLSKLPGLSGLVPFFGIFLSTILLSGCVGMGSSFDCNVKSGGRCASMDKINNLADADLGAFDKSYARYANYPRSRSLKLKNIDGKVSNSGHLSGANVPLRSCESIQQIWIAPYEDNSGNYHLSSDVYTVVKSGGWIGSPVSEV